MAKSIAALRAVAFLALGAVTVGGACSRTARADEYGRDRWRQEHQDGYRDGSDDRLDDRRHGWDDRRDDRRHGWDERRRDNRDWSHEHYDDDRRRPDVYYSAPPVVIEPRGYYVQPGVSLGFSFPFYR